MCPQSVALGVSPVNLLSGCQFADASSIPQTPMLEIPSCYCACTARRYAAGGIPPVERLNSWCRCAPSVYPHLAAISAKVMSDQRM